MTAPNEHANENANATKETTPAQPSPETTSSATTDAAAPMVAAPEIPDGAAFTVERSYRGSRSLVEAARDLAKKFPAGWVALRPSDSMLFVNVPDGATAEQRAWFTRAVDEAVSALG